MAVRLLKHVCKFQYEKQINQCPGKDFALNSDLDAFSFTTDRLLVHTAGFVAISLMILGRR